MARPRFRDTFARFTALPSCLLLLACLALPQMTDCHGHVQSAREAGTTPFIVILALIALVPLLWQVPSLREALAVLAALVCTAAVVTNVLVIPVGIYFLIARPWRSREQFVAFACSTIAIVFLLLFPVLSLFSTWLEGAELAWATAWVVLAANVAWGSAARERADLPEDIEQLPDFVVPAPRTPAPLPGPIGDYVLEERIGARTYRVRNRETDTVHALELVDRDYPLAEAAAQARRLVHPHILPVTNVVTTPEHAALVMEHVDGVSLTRVMPDLPGDPDEIARIMFGILAAVEHAHRAGVVHGDLTDENVVLAGRERLPRVKSFGATPGGSVASDVFALGVLLYQMTVGRPPFTGSDTLGYFLPEVIDRRIARVIETALQPDPARRYASCALMAMALSADGR